MADPRPFWTAKTLGTMTRAEWESLCDGCGRCCLHKLRDDETDRIAFTEVACRLLDAQSCRCGDYANRRQRVPDCVKLTPAKLAGIDWLPPTCAYRLLAEGRDLAWWHPLVSGDPETVHRAGISVRGRVVAEREAGALEDHVVPWPGRWPRQAGPVPRQGGAGSGGATAGSAGTPRVAIRRRPAAAAAPPPPVPRDRDETDGNEGHRTP